MNINNSVSNFLTHRATVQDIKLMTNEELIYNMRKNGIESHVFYKKFDVLEIMARVYSLSNYAPSVLIIEAVRRYKLTDNTKAALASKFAKASGIVLTAVNVVVQETSKVSTMAIVRGSIQVNKEVNKDDRMEHSYGAMVQLYKPVKNKLGDGFVPQFTDAEAKIYPRPGIAMPDFLCDAYAHAATAELVVSECLKVANRATTTLAKAQLNLVAPVLIASGCGPSNLLQLTAAYGKPSERERTNMDMCGVVGMEFVPGYAPVPKADIQPTFLSAYNYLLQSRLVRGQDSRGLSFNSVGYFYGDLPSCWQRAVNTAHNLKWIFESVARHVKDPPSALYYNSDIASFSSAYEIVAANMRIASATTKNQNLIPKMKSAVGWEEMIATKTYLVPLYVDRQFAIKKNELSFTPDYKNLMTSVNLQMTQLKKLAENYKVKFLFALLSKACPDLMKRFHFFSSMHAHNGSAWFLLNGGTPSKELVVTNNDFFATRLSRANAWKNYYPFHRVPMVKMDLDCNFSLILKRGGVVTPNMLVLLDEYGPGEEKFDVADEVFLEDLMTEEIRRSAITAADHQKKLGFLPPVQQFPVLIQLEDREPRGVNFPPVEDVIDEVDDGDV